MKLSDGEKLILMMLSDIYDHLEVDGDLDTKLIREAILHGQLWGIQTELSGILHGGDVDEATVQETVRILSMWRVIEQSLQGLSPEEKKRIEEEAAPFGRDPQFRGFDGNNDRHFGVAQFYIKNLGRFPEFADREINSHSLVIDSYRHMLGKYDELIQGDSFTTGILTVDQLVAILKYP